MLKISNPHSYPFGLLSNKAVTPFTLNGDWSSVSHYVYVNMFSDDAQRTQMKEYLLGGNHYQSMLDIKQKAEDDLFRRSSLKALKLRFEQYPKLRDALQQTRGLQLVHPDANISILLNGIRSDINYVFDPLRGVNVPRNEVLTVIAGVEQELLKNHRLDDNLVYTDLLKYAARRPAEIPPADKIFLNINNIVPVLKLKLQTKLWEKETEIFKPHLLDVYLNYILETEYPHLEYGDYAEAKKQQFEKEGEESLYMLNNHLLDLYIKGGTPDPILRRLQFTPDNSLMERELMKREEVEEVVEEILTVPEPEIKQLILTDNSPFLPQFLEDVRVDGLDFASAVHYAYYTLLQQVGGLPFSVNEIPINELNFVFFEQKNMWISESLKALNERATEQKFATHSSLVFLLRSSNGEIVYDDSDMILGSKGLNMAGKFLTYLRDEQIPLRFMQPFDILAKNVSVNDVWMKFWRNHIVKRYKTTLRKMPPTNSLEKVYNIQPTRVNGILAIPTQNDISELKAYGLSDEEIVVIFPFVVTAYHRLIKNRNGRDLQISEMFKNETKNKN